MENGEFLKVSSQNLVLGSNQRKKVDFTVLCLSKGNLEIYGMSWILQGTIRCRKFFKEHFTIAKKTNKINANFKFRSSIAQLEQISMPKSHESRALQPISKIKIPILPQAPLLRLSTKSPFKSEMLCGEYQQFELVLLNDSNYLIDDLEVKISHPVYLSAFYQKSKFFLILASKFIYLLLQMEKKVECSNSIVKATLTFQCIIFL